MGPLEWRRDFRCRGCDGRARLVYAHGDEFAMGCWMYDMVAIIEDAEPRRRDQPDA